MLDNLYGVRYKYDILGASQVHLEDLFTHRDGRANYFYI